MPLPTDENPFGDPTVDNPFSDPAVQKMTTKPPQIQQGLEEYNPFAADGSSRPKTLARGASNPPQYGDNAGPAVMSPTEMPFGPPSYTRTAQQVQPTTLTTTELQRRQEELDRKAAELERREQELRRNETNVRKNNWPPLPDNFCWQPCFYLDISVEIPPDFQRVVTHLYYMWLYHTALLFANVVGSLILLFWKGDFGRFILSVIYTAILTPSSFLCWFRPGYKAFRNDSSFNFMVFFFIFFFQFLVSLDQSIGFGDSGFCGIIPALGLFDGTVGGTLIALIILTIALGFCAAAVMDLLLITKIHRIYRSTGASFAKAQQEFTRGILSNEHVRGAAANVAREAVSSQFSPPTQQTPTNRF